MSTLVSIQLGNKSAAWFAANPTLILLSGQIVYLDDQSGTYKKGDGTTQLSGLSFLGGATSTPTLQQVLTAGSVITGNNVVTGAFNFEFGSQASRIAAFQAHVTGNYEMQSDGGNDFHSYISGNQYGAYAGWQDDISGLASSISFKQTDTVVNNGVNNNLIVEDQISSKGLVYMSDYSANFTPESLVSKRWVDSNYQPLDSDLTSWALITRASGFDTFATTPSSLNLYGLLTTKTGTLNNVFSDSPVFTTTIFTSRVTGGTGVNDGVDFISTTGAGTSSSAAFNFKGGTNGGTMILTALNDGTLRIPNNRQFQGTDSGGVNRAIFTWSSGDNLTFTGKPGSTDIIFNPTSSGVGMYIKSSGDVGIGAASPAARCHIIKTTEQLRVGYDTSNYFKATVGSTGSVTLDAIGAGAKFTFSDNVELTQTVTTEALVSDTSVTIVINGITYKLLAKA